MSATDPVSSTDPVDPPLTPPGVRRLVVQGRALVAKSATGRARAGLRQEARLLDHLAEMPVVRLVALRDSDDRTDVVTRDAGSASLATAAGMAPAQILVSLAGAADAVAHLHRNGWTHGAICAEHVVLDDDGRVTLCSVGSARPATVGSAAIDEDVSALVALIRGVLARSDPSWTLGTTLRWMQLSRRLERDLCSATSAVLAATAVRRVADLAPGPVAAPAGRDRTRAALSPPAVRLLSGALVVAVFALVWGAADAADAGPPAPDAAPEHPDAPVPPTSDVATPTRISGNQVVISGVPHRAGGPGDRAASAPTSCGAEPVVIVLRPGTGQVFAIDGGPARLLSTAPEGTDLAIVDRPCRRAVLVHEDGSVQPIEGPPSEGSDQEDETP